MIVVLGDIAVDITSYLRTPLLRGSDAPADVRVTSGGSGANVAAWLGRLHEPVTFLGRVGDDPFGRYLAADLASEGVTLALRVDRVHPTAVIQVLVEPGGERTMIPDRGANAHWEEGDIPEDAVATADFLHVVGYVLFDPGSRYGALRAMDIARAHRVPISLDPSSHGPLAGLGASAFWSLAGRVDVLLPNRFEAATLSGEADPERALAALQRHADLVITKLDRDGCIAVSAGDTRIHREPAPAITVVNSTGAGDAFDAAFLATWVRGRKLAEACRAAVAFGSRAAALSTTR